MTLSYMLDTDHVSYALRGQGAVGAAIVRHKPSELCMSAITLAELRYGADKRDSDKLRRVIEAFADSVAVVPFDAGAAIQYGRVSAALANAGTPIGQMDTLIAAHAISLEITLVTNNGRHFERVGGLATENWS